MSKFINFFYIFSKFTTSLILFVLLIFTGYALYKSYNGINNISSKADDRFIAIISDIENNKLKIFEYEKLIKENQIFLKELKDYSLATNYEKNILSIQNTNKILIKKIENINTFLNDLKLTENFNINNAKNNNAKEISSLKELILSKYKEGSDVREEIEILENFATNTSNNVFEKLYIIQSKNFYGKDKLKLDFEISLENYVKYKFLSKNQNSVIKFLFKYINIKPNNLSSHENSELNTLILASNYLDFEKYDDSLNQVLSLSDRSAKFFDSWINQITLIIELNSYLSKVK